MENMTENNKKNISVFAKVGARYRFACGAAPAWLRSDGSHSSPRGHAQERGMLGARGSPGRGGVGTAAVLPQPAGRKIPGTDLQKSVTTYGFSQRVLTGKVSNHGTFS